MKNVPADGATDEVEMKWGRGRWWWWWWRQEVVASLVVLLHYDLPVKHPSPLPQHVEEELRKHWGKYSGSINNLSDSSSPIGLSSL